MGKTLYIEAKTLNLDKVTAFVEAELKEKGCTLKQIMQVRLVVEEIFVNIARYAYVQIDPEGRVIPNSGTGPVEIFIDIDDSRILLTFIDEGKEYNPLKKEDPDIMLPPEDRRIGGLGIYMVKKIMDEVEYRYEGGKNILSVTKMRS